MPRPCKRRRVCELPTCGHFGPLDLSPSNTEPVTLTLEEFECIRLIDLSGLTQEQCADEMNVARTTVQAIYGTARKKIADSLVNARELVITGGNYVFCTRKQQKCVTCICQPNQFQEETIMKIAVTYENGQIFQHFGHTETFKVYDIDNGKVVSSAVVSTNGSGHGALAGVLTQLQADTLICGGIGGGAQMALSSAGIRLFAGISGDADQAVEALLAGTLECNPNPTCDHHHEGEAHHGNCGEHGCGEHSCQH